MNARSCLNTRTEKCCPQCGQEFVLADPTDVLAVRPIEVDLVCPDCHFPGRATLTHTNQFRSVYPSPDATSPADVANDNEGWLTAEAYNPLPSFKRPDPEFSDREHPSLILLN